MSKINWTQVVILGVVALLVFLIGASLLGGYAGWGMREPGMMGNWGFGPFGWLVMSLMWLFPLGLLVLGIVWLVRQVSSPAGPAADSPQATAGRPCPNCGRPTQADASLPVLGAGVDVRESMTTGTRYPAGRCRRWISKTCRASSRAWNNDGPRYPSANRRQAVPGLPPLPGGSGVQSSGHHPP